MNHEKVAENLINKIGGKGNIAQCWHCITRLRITVLDKDLVDLGELKEAEGVIDAFFSGEQLQIVIGNQVAKVHEHFLDHTGELQQEEVMEKKKPHEVVMDTIAGIFTPILPAIIGAGLIKGLMSMVATFQWLDMASNEATVLSMISDAPFYFLPFLLAVSAAKKFKTSEYLSVTMAGILMYPTLIDLASGGEVSALKFFGLPLQVLNYSSSVLPIILTVLLLSYVYRFVDKYVPSVVRIIFTPLIVLAIVAPISLAAIAPLGHYIGVYVELFFATLFGIAGPLAGALMGGTLSVIVITGMQHTFIPSTLASLGSVGFDTVLLPMSLVSNLAQFGATLAVAIRTKDVKMKSIAYSSAISAVFGITEPAIYGVTLKLKKPFYAALVGGAVGGGIFGTFTVKAMAFGIPGITALPTYVEQGTNNFLWALLGAVAATVIGFTLTLVLGVEEAKQPTKETVQETAATTVYAPLSGTKMPLTAVSDRVFAEEIIGKGLAIEPNDNRVLAPFDGMVSMVTPTKHAVGLTSNDGVELLIHVGLDTIGLNGEGFHMEVAMNQKVQKGDLLLTFNREAIEEKGLSCITPIVVTNLKTDQSLDYAKQESFEFGEELFNV